MVVRRVIHVASFVLVVVGIAMTTAGGVALLYGEGDAPGIFLAAAITVACGVGGYRFTAFEGDLSHRDGFAIVTFAWLVSGIFGALPYLLTGSIPMPVPAIFESISGFTTTGATVVTEIESLPHGILFWRSLTQWLGGMGIVVLVIAILPFLGVGGMQLFRAEVPGPTPDRLRPRITQTAKLLWYVYLGLSVAQTALYLLGGLPLFEAMTHTFATLPTGGFSPKNASIAAYDSAYIHWVTIAFMYLAGVNFALHFRAATGRPLYWKDAEWRFFTALVVGSGLLLALFNLDAGLYGWRPAELERAIRDGLFQATSIVTTTGYVTADYGGWAPAAQGLLFTLFFVGGMAGSTGGSVKAVRILLLLKHAVNEIRKHLHPRAVILTRIGEKPVKEEILGNVIGFVILYGFLFLAGSFLMSLTGMDLMTALGASAATVGNIGPGFGDVGPVDNYAWISDSALAILSFLMIVGRLEIYTVLLLFHPELWRAPRHRRVS